MSVLLVGNSNSYSFRTKKQFCRGERSRSLTFLPVWSNFILGILQVSDPKELRNIFWPLRDDNRPHRSISSNNTIYVLCWAFVGRMLGVCWAHVGAAFGLVGHMFSHDGPIFWVHVGPMSVLCWGMLGHFGPMLGPCWAYVGPCCLCWAHFGPMLAHVGPILGHVETKFGNLADFRPLEKTWNTQDSRANMSPQGKT